MPEKPLEMHRDQPGQDASNSTNRPPFHEMQPGRRGGSAGTIRGDRAVAPVAADNCEPGDLLSVPGIMPNLGALPAASTEVVLAEGCYSALPLVVRYGRGVPPPLCDELLAQAVFSSPIPVLVTGNQPRRVCAVNESTLSRNESLLPKDLVRLDSCDKHRNEGCGEGCAHPLRTVLS